MKFILIVGSLLMTAAGALGIADFKSAYDNGTLTFIQGNDSHKTSTNHKVVTERDRRMQTKGKEYYDTAEFYMESFSRGAIDYDFAYDEVAVAAEDYITIEEE